MSKYIYKLKKGSNRQLICFPYLGGYANSFSKLIAHLKEDVEVWSCNPPGHGGSVEPPLEDITRLIDLYYRSLDSVINLPYILFGHSMGAIVAYFLLQKIVNGDSSFQKPKAIILSAANTPGFFRDDNIATLPDDKIVERLRCYDGVSKEILDEKTLINYFLPTYRADFSVLKSSAQCSYSLLEVPVYYIYASNDEVVSIDEVYRWSNYLGSTIKLQILRGAAHMYVEKDPILAAKTIDKIFADIFDPLQREPGLFNEAG